MGAHHIIVANTSSYNVGSDTFEGCGQDATWLVFTGNDTFIQVGDPHLCAKHIPRRVQAPCHQHEYRRELSGRNGVLLDQDTKWTMWNSREGRLRSVQLGMLLDGTGTYSGGSSERFT